MISSAAAAAINDPSNDLCLSEASILEVVLKHAASKLPIDEATGGLSLWPYDNGTR